MRSSRFVVESLLMRRDDMFDDPLAQCESHFRVDRQILKVCSAWMVDLVPEMVGTESVWRYQAAARNLFV